MKEQALSRKLARLEAKTLKLLADVGKLCEQYDSMRTSSALGHIERAADDLKQAKFARQAFENNETADAATNRVLGGPHVITPPK